MLHLMRFLEFGATLLTLVCICFCRDTTAFVHVGSLHQGATLVPCRLALGNWAKDTTKKGCMTMSLSGKEKRALRSLAAQKRKEGCLHVMNLGRMDPQDGFMQELDVSLRSHELVNVRLAAAEKKAEAKDLGATLAQMMDAELVQTLGHTVLLFRKGKGPKSRIDLNKMLKPAQ